MKRKKQWTSMTRLCVLLGLILTGMVSFTAWYLNRPLPAASEGVADTGAAVSETGETLSKPEILQEVPGDPEGQPVQDVLAPEETVGGSRIVNILLVGQDRLEGQGRTRSDSMILCTFNKRTREITLTSFLRDLYVKIPGYGGNRINAAYAYGGMELLEQTLEENFAITVDGTVEVDFSGFAQIIDRLGGVDMELREDEAALITRETGYDTQAGMQHLCGDQALNYARIRKLDADGDFSRTSRQRALMNAMLDAYRDAKLTTVLLLLNDVLPIISTDMSGGEIMGYALELFPMLSGSSIRQQHIPAAGQFRNQTIDGMAVLVPDLEESRELLAQTLMGS